MKAIVYEKLDRPRFFIFKKSEKPTPKANEVLIKIVATTRQKRISRPGAVFLVIHY